MNHIVSVVKSKLVVTLIAVAACSAIALAAGWTKLGERKVSDRMDHDTLNVTGARGKFTALKIMVKGHDVRFQKVVVHFHNGSKEELTLRDVIPAGGESRVIDLPGKERVIKTIDFWYEAESVGHAGAEISVWGRR